MLDGASDVQIHDAGLDDGTGIFEVEFEDAIHARKHEHDAAAARECAAGKTGSRAAANDGHIVFDGELNDARHILCGVRKDDDVGPRFFDRTVVLIEDQVLDLMENIGGTEQGIEFAE